MACLIPNLTFEILLLYIDGIPRADLKAIRERTFTSEIFGTHKVSPVRSLETALYIEELSNGPILALKDMAMQLLGNLLEYVLARRHDELNIIGATSGTLAARQHSKHRYRGLFDDCQDIVKFVSNDVDANNLKSRSYHSITWPDLA